MLPTEAAHIPVLLQESLDILGPRSGGRYIDGTAGLGGHAEAILRACSPRGRLLGLEMDPSSAEKATHRLKPFTGRYHIVNENYTSMLEVASRYGLLPADGLLLDLGLSSWQLEEGRRGFSFRAEEPLDMRYDPSSLGITAAEVVNTFGLEELTQLLRRYGEERHARQIARAIIRSRPIRTAAQLARVVADTVGHFRTPIHPATRTFQALRIVVNEELANLEKGLQQSLLTLASGGRMLVISYHSLEDRLVKQFLQREARDCICPPGTPMCICGHKATIQVLTKKAVRPTQEEVRANPRSRSARLRAGQWM